MSEQTQSQPDSARQLEPQSLKTGDEAATRPVAPMAPQVAADNLATPELGRIAQYALVALALFVVGCLLWRARGAMAPFIFGLVLAYLLMPVVDRLARGMPRPLAIVLVYINSLALLGFGPRSPRPGAQHHHGQNGARELPTGSKRPPDRLYIVGAPSRTD